MAPDSVLRGVFGKLRPKLAGLDKKAELAEKVSAALAETAVLDEGVKVDVSGVEKNMDKAMELKVEGNTAFKVTTRYAREGLF